MILADTSVWIDHLHAKEPLLASFLADDEIGAHPSVIEELALGSIARRDAVLELMENLRQFPVLAHTEVMTLVARGKLRARGLSAVDVHLLGSVLLVAGARMWTRDERLRAACRDMGVPCVEER